MMTNWTVDGVLGVLGAEILGALQWKDKRQQEIDMQEILFKQTFSWYDGETLWQVTQRGCAVSSCAHTWKAWA